MGKISRIVVATLLCCSMLSGCEGEESSIPSEIVGFDVSQVEEKSAFPVTVCGAELDKAVERAVSLSPTITEILFELGLSNKLFGVSDYCDFPEDISATRLGSPENPDMEEIMSLLPDVEFTISPLSERETYLLNQANIDVLEIPVATSIEGYSQIYSEIATAFYGKETVGELEGRKSAEIAVNARKALEESAKGIDIGSFVFVTEKLTLAGSDTFENAVISLTGENACTASGYIPTEGFECETPAFIIADDTLTVNQVKSDAVLGAMMKNGAKLWFVDSRCFERPTARTAEVFSELRDATSE